MSHTVPTFCTHGKRSTKLQKGKEEENKTKKGDFLVLKGAYNNVQEKDKRTRVLKKKATRERTRRGVRQRKPQLEALGLRRPPN